MTSNLSKMLQKGQRITVLCPFVGALSARVASHGSNSHRRGRVRWTARGGGGFGKPGQHGGEVRRRDEGATWARGWDTPEAQSLRVAAALAGTGKAPITGSYSRRIDGSTVSGAVTCTNTTRGVFSSNS
jgi:hypothetical protein